MPEVSLTWWKSSSVSLVAPSFLCSAALPLLSQWLERVLRTRMCMQIIHGTAERCLGLLEKGSICEPGVYGCGGRLERRTKNLPKLLARIYHFAITFKNLSKQGNPAVKSSVTDLRLSVTLKFTHLGVHLLRFQYSFDFGFGATPYLINAWLFRGPTQILFMKIL